MAEFGLGLFVGFLISMFLFRDRVEKRVLETESEAIQRVRSKLTKDIAELEQRLVDRQCGWSEGDSIRMARSISQRVLNMLPEQQS
jgi:S-ribosylhomocysteine lyase LuxS involved in autoinducer biosynthesis